MVLILLIIWLLWSAIDTKTWRTQQEQHSNNATLSPVSQGDATAYFKGGGATPGVFVPFPPD